MSDFFDNLCNAHLKKHERTICIRAASGRPACYLEEVPAGLTLGADEWVASKKAEGITEFVVELHENGTITELWSGTV